MEEGGGDHSSKRWGGGGAGQEVGRGEGHLLGVRVGLRQTLTKPKMFFEALQMSHLGTKSGFKRGLQMAYFLGF